MKKLISQIKSLLGGVIRLWWERNEMKIAIIALSTAVVIFLVFEAVLTFQNLDFRWKWQNADREWAVCRQDLSNANQAKTIQCNNERSALYKQCLQELEDSQSDEFPLIEELSYDEEDYNFILNEEFDIYVAVPTTEDAYVAPPEEFEVESFAEDCTASNAVCYDWVFDTCTKCTYRNL